LSQGGTQVEVPGLVAGDEMVLSFRLPRTAALVEAVGVVVWLRQERQGIHFIDMGLESQEKVRDFISDLDLSPK
jgi:hypothetical protein